MQIRTIAMMLTLLVAGLAIGCSTAPLPTYTPYPTYTPVAPAPMLTEKEAIEIARAYYPTHNCWERQLPGPEFETNANYTRKYSDFNHSESASFKPNGLWIVMAETSYITDMEWSDEYKEWHLSIKGLIPLHEQTADPTNGICTVVVDDANARVRPD